MQIQEKKIRDIIKQEILKISGLRETDLVAPNKSSWDNKKAEFKMLVSNLLNNLETDDYKDAAGEISKTINILQSWKNKIDKGLTDNVKEGHDEENYFVKKDLEQLQNDSEAARNHPETIAAARELATIAPNINDLHLYLQNILDKRGITDSDQIQHIIDQAVTIMKS